MHKKVRIQSGDGKFEYDVEIEVWRDSGDLFRYEAWCGGVSLVRGTFECISAQGAFDQAFYAAKRALA